jgi:hypothetical protein
MTRMFGGSVCAAAAPATRPIAAAASTGLINVSLPSSDDGVRILRRFGCDLALGITVTVAGA